MGYWDKQGLVTIANDRYDDGEGNLIGDFRQLNNPSFTYNDITQQHIDTEDPSLTNDTIILELLFKSNESEVSDAVIFRFENRNVTTILEEIKWQLLNSSLYSDFTYNT